MVVASGFPPVTEPPLVVVAGAAVVDGAELVEGAALVEGAELVDEAALVEGAALTGVWGVVGVAISELVAGMSEGTGSGCEEEAA